MTAEPLDRRRLEPAEADFERREVERDVPDRLEERDRVWLGAGRMIIENATNLDQLPERAQVVVAPLKVRGANGAPARIFALLPD